MTKKSSNLSSPSTSQLLSFTNIFLFFLFLLFLAKNYLDKGRWIGDQTQKRVNSRTRQLSNQEVEVSFINFLLFSFFHLTQRAVRCYYLLSHSSLIRFRLVFSQFLGFCGNISNVKEKQIRKTCFSHENKCLVPRYLAKFCQVYFFDVNDVSIVLPQEIDIK